MKYPNVGVYYDSDSVRYHFSNFKHVNPIHDCVSYNNLEEFLHANCSIKIAALHVPYPFTSKFRDQVLVISAKCDHVFVIATELHPEIAAFIQATDLKNITYYICGFLNFELEHAKVKQFMDWFETSTYFYRHWLPEILTRLQPYHSKYRAFDILLGRKKLHRDQLYQHTRDRPYLGIISYFRDHNTKLGNDPEEWIWEHTGVKIAQTPEWTVDRVNYYGHTMSLSQIIPINVYNQTAYSVVAETCFHDNFAFYTEKTSKPIIARRLFVMFAGKNYLANLRKFGFQTFGSIIDESYDQETDALVRWRRAWEQMVWLADQPQEQILEQVRPIVEHNFEVIMTTNWADNFRQEFEQDLVRTIAAS
jgi:hypothetical protein